MEKRELSHTNGKNLHWYTHFEEMPMFKGTGCLGLVHLDDPEGWYREEGGRGVQDGVVCDS